MIYATLEHVFDRLRRKCRPCCGLSFGILMGPSAIRTQRLHRGSIPRLHTLGSIVLSSSARGSTSLRARPSTTVVFMVSCASIRLLTTEDLMIDQPFQHSPV